MTIHVHIERLVLRGIPLTATDRAELAAALQAELAALLAAEDGRSYWAELGDRADVDGGSTAYQPGGSPIRLGKAVAASLFESLRSDATRPRGSA